MTPQNQAKDAYNFILYVPENLHHKYKVTRSHKVVLEFDVNPVKRSILDIIRIQSKKTGLI